MHFQIVQFSPIILQSEFHRQVTVEHTQHILIQLQLALPAIMDCRYRT